MEKIDLTLDSIIAGDFNKWLLPQHIRDYLYSRDLDIFPRLPKYWQIVNPKFLGTDIWEEYHKNYDNAALLYLRLFNESYERLHYFKGKDECHRCGVSLHVINRVLDLCSSCDDLTSEYAENIL